MASKYVDTSSIVQVIGCVYKTPQLLEYTDKYFITEDDFPNPFHKIVFGTAYNLHELGAEKITMNSVLDYLAARPNSEAIFIKEKGEEWILKAVENAQVAAFDYYYNRMKKMTLLRAFDNIGIDLTDIYDPNNILDIKKKQAQEDLLDNSSLDSLAQMVQDKIDTIKATYVDNSWSEAHQAGDNVFELIEELKQKPDVGVPLFGSMINTVTRGARLGKMYLRSAATGVGKAIPNNTIIPTPNGKKRVGDIKVGDYLFGDDGLPTKVIAIHPQPTKKKVWKVYFKDGRIAECCKDHLWEYYYYSHRSWEPRVETTEELYQRAQKLKNIFKTSDNKGYRFKIKLNQPVQYPEKILYPSPYAMGALLGDGSFRYDNTNKALVFSSDNDELPLLVAKELGDNVIIKKSSNLNYSYTFKQQDNIMHNLWVEEILKNYPELWQTKSETKFIPTDYLNGSIEQRYELLRGLLDTDGSIEKEKGRVNFTTVSPYLRDNVIDLCHSLGMITSYCIDLRSDKYTTNECYNIHIQCSKQQKTLLFKLERKKNIAISYANNRKREEMKEFNPIINIEPTDIEAEMTCFTVDNNSHLFLMNDYIVTHNTRSLIADACFIGCNRIYDASFGKWLKNGTAEPTLFIATEQDLSEVQTMMLAFLSDVNEEHIMNGRYVGDEEERVMEAAKILKDSPLYVELLPDFSIDDVENVIKKNIRENGVSYVFYDYIQSSLKILEEIAKKTKGMKLREDNILFMLSARLKDICNHYGIFLMSATQLNGSYIDSETPDQNLLRGAKSIADRIDFGAILLGVSSEDLKGLEEILKNNGFENPNVKISVYKNRRGRYKGIYLWCNADLGTCRIRPVFATTYNYEIVEISNLKINTTEPGAF